MQPKGNTSFALVPPKKRRKFTPTQEEDNKVCMHTHFHQWESANWVLIANPYKTKVLLASFFPPYLPHFPGPICVLEVPIYTHFDAAHYPLWALEVPIHTHFDAAHYKLWALEVPIHTFWFCPLHTLSPKGAHRHTFWCCPLHTLSLVMHILCF
jgi:hypothetical protein